jgi:phage baseplate assembly protein W|tara:strand:- start:21136 stop:21624 length:489 start_codon:yes stop_codon:yes gene_type:complete
MALIKITDVSVDASEDVALKEGYLYKDLLLDIETAVYYNQQLNTTVTLKDVQGSYDMDSIKNSIKNIFLTTPGQKILSPTFGINLRRFLFEPVSNFTAYRIKADILNNLPDMEPRIELEEVTVIPVPDEHEFYVTLQINVPSLNAYGISLRSLLNSNGYYIL